MTINCKGESLILSKDRAIYWAEKEMLIISDLHIGKAAHFRRAGIQVPGTVNSRDLERLDILIGLYNPQVLLITGDMFHDGLNTEVGLFGSWRSGYPDLKIVLIKGNHDRLKGVDYEALSIEVEQKELICGPFRFVHDKPVVFDEYYNITGHVHPGVTIYGKAKQRLRLPCFYFGKTCAILPAFSVFTGLSKIVPEEGDVFYAVTPQEVIRV